mgnify:CR=1 FL=1
MLEDFSLDSSLIRLVLGVIIISNLGFAFYIYKDDAFPLSQRLPFIIGALITGPFVFGRMYFKKVDQLHRRQLNEQHRRYAARRPKDDED